MNFIMNLSFAFFAILFSVSGAAAKSSKGLPFPKEFLQCKRGDPKVDVCTRDAIQKAVSYLAKGLPKYGFVPIDPMFTTVITMTQDFGPIPINVSFHNVTTTGYSGVIVQKAHVDEEDHKITASVSLPRVVMAGTYELKAKVFLFPLEGKGPFDITMDDITADLRFVGKPQLRSGSEYLKIKRVPFDMDIKKITFNFGNILNSDGRLGENINRFLNRFSGRIFKELKPLADETQGKIAEKLAQPFFDRVPFPSLLQ